MTSEQALKDLKELRELWELNCWSNDSIHWELVDKVIEDLEVLEIIKQLLKAAKVLKNNEVDLSHCITILSDSTNKQLKEWLEKC